MRVAIIAAAGALNYRLVDEKINTLIESSGCYLFTILCGSIEGKKSKEAKTLGEIWAERNGAPVEYIFAKTENELIDKMIFKADYVIFILDDNPLTKNIFMRYKMSSNKHGSVIKV